MKEKKGNKVENIIIIRQRLKEIEKRLESRRDEILAEIETCKTEKEEAQKKAEECLDKGDVKGRVKALDLFFFNKARIERLEEELKEPENDTQTRAEAEELIKTAKAEARKKIKEAEDVYFEFWQKVKEAEKEADKVVTASRNIITRCERITKNTDIASLSNPFQNMLESTRKSMKFFEAWRRLDKRKKYQK